MFSVGKHIWQNQPYAVRGTGQGLNVVITQVPTPGLCLLKKTRDETTSRRRGTLAMEGDPESGPPNPIADLTFLDVDTNLHMMSGTTNSSLSRMSLAAFPTHLQVGKSFVFENDLVVGIIH